MNEAIRERLGQAAYAARRAHLEERIRALGEAPLKGLAWEDLQEQACEFYRVEAEAAVLFFADLFMPVIRNMLSEDEIKRLLKSLE